MPLFGTVPNNNGSDVFVKRILRNTIAFFSVFVRSFFLNQAFLVWIITKLQCQHIAEGILKKVTSCFFKHFKCFERQNNSKQGHK
jgi:hypothetical protein